ncbi:hypothetical protein GLX30_06745 [Streptomyces sp. Tu 2975]|uniref:hypothetical protein n=1 Tax=Streptomyces sp. Tu 2975 TaxID=2676871 RepID=UPI001359D297|nr:hypothetical protein [Streptomyces sp. Tu 2975]QIP83816.1 hypothetical protein GLX30_06745 [Streptomyces sp. Tu 2975]
MRSLQYDMAFRARAKRTQTWGFALLSVAALLWVWFGVLLLLPYTLDSKYGEGRECESRLLTEWGTANEGGEDATCESERDWPELLGVLGLSVPVAVVGTALYTSGSVGNRLSEHAAEVARLMDAERPAKDNA